MTKAGVDRIDGTVLVTLNPNGTFTNVRLKSVNPGNMRNPALRTFANALTSSACKAEGSSEAYDVEFEFGFKLE